jgi:hypothetical protein
MCTDKVKFKFGRFICEILPCTAEDMDRSIKATADITGMEYDVQLKRLQDCVDNGTAFKVVKNGIVSTSLYYEILRKGFLRKEVIAVLFDVVDPVDILIVGFYFQHFKGITSYKYLPHDKTGIKFLSMITKNSVRSYHQFKTPIQVVMKNRYFKLVNKLGVEVLNE